MSIVSYVSLFWIVHYYLLQQAVEVRGQNISVCLPSAEFSSMCAARSGFVYGSQCFFVASEVSDWTNGWTLCEAVNATMAHMHNSKVLDWAFKEGDRLDREILFANKRYYTPDIWPRDLTQFYWHKSFGDYWTNFTWGNTWARFAQDADDNNQGDTFTAFHGDHYIGDGNGIYPMFYVMCQIWNVQQTFAKAMPGSCIDEQPIIDIAVTSAQDCADTCAQYMWCFTFNVITAPSKKCQLFSWDLNDTPNLKSDSNCVIYQNNV